MYTDLPVTEIPPRYKQTQYVWSANEAMTLLEAMQEVVRTETCEGCVCRKLRLAIEDGMQEWGFDVEKGLEGLRDGRCQRHQEQVFS